MEIRRKRTHYNSYELFVCKLVDAMYISGALILFIASLITAVRILTN